mmetsp:Transcript_26102/g.43115  ORF Transcript_26102/g.43115 Transcript_26102/m.43115 type:complete len:98 (+) Transcript_26102:874-1167(+)
MVRFKMRRGRIVQAAKPERLRNFSCLAKLCILVSALFACSGWITIGLLCIKLMNTALQCHGKSLYARLGSNAAIAWPRQREQETKHFLYPLRFQSSL